MDDSQVTDNFESSIADDDEDDVIDSDEDFELVDEGEQDHVDLENKEESSDEESEVDLATRWKNHVENFDWKEDVSFEPLVHEFSDAFSGVQENSFHAESTPLEIFEYFYSGDVIAMICQMTNSYHDKQVATLKNSGKLKPNSRCKKWWPVTNDELFVFYGLVMLMGIIKKPKIDMYWSTNPLFSTPIFATLMSRN